MARRRSTALPTGTVTFLFTDIEGSTRLVQSLGERYPALLETHARLVRVALRDHQGIEVSTEGDAFFAVFGSAADALLAAIDCQRALATGPWPDGFPVKVRMGLHTGAGQLGGDDYVGLDVHRAARIASAAHGGQILTSATTHALAEGAMPEGVTARDLGLHRLKDLDRPERLFEIIVAGPPTHFPAPRTVGGPAMEIPTPLSSIVGRADDIDAVLGLLRDSRLVTLTGPGGMGKTRLAMEVARRSQAALGHGASFVALDAVSDPSLVASTIIQALGLREEDRPAEELLASHLGERRLLLVLDNFEQVVSAAGLVERMLRRVPGLRVLATSRTSLQIAGEQEFPLDPLRLPDPRALPPLAELEQFEAVQLFVERATAVRPGFSMNAQNAASVAAICNRLDGLPLAIELAAARIKLLPPDAILGRLEQHLDVLSSRSPNVPLRQRSILGTIVWSLDLLEEPERHLFDRLSTFSGSWHLAAADAVCQPADLGIDVLDGVSSLVDQSLVRRIADAGPRFAILRTIQDVGRVNLAERGETDSVARRHAAYFLEVATAIEPHLSAGDPHDAVEALLVDQDNLRSALEWAIDHQDAELGIRLGASIWRFWQLRGQLTEGRRWLDRLLALPGASATVRALGLTATGGIAYWQGDGTARGLYEEALAVLRSIGDDRGIADGLQNLAFTFMGTDTSRAIDLFKESLAIYRALDDRRNIASVVEAIGFAEVTSGRFAESSAALTEALALNVAVGSRGRANDNRMALGHVYRMTGDLDRAAAFYLEALADTKAIGDASRLLVQLDLICSWASVVGRHADAIRLSAAVQHARDEHGGSISYSYPGLLVDPVRAALDSGQIDEAEIARAQAQGRELQLEEAVDEALAMLMEADGGRDPKTR